MKLVKKKPRLKPTPPQVPDPPTASGDTGKEIVKTTMTLPLPLYRRAKEYGRVRGLGLNSLCRLALYELLHQSPVSVTPRIDTRSAPPRRSFSPPAEQTLTVSGEHLPSGTGDVTIPWDVVERYQALMESWGIEEHDPTPRRLARKLNISEDEVVAAMWAVDSGEYDAYLKRRQA